MTTTMSTPPPTRRTAALTARRTAALAELFWFLGPPIILAALLALAVVHYEHRLTLAYAREHEAMEGWRRSVGEQEVSAGSLKVCSARLEAAVEILRERVGPPEPWQREARTAR